MSTRKFTTSLSILFLTLAALAGPALAQNKPRVAVLEFDNQAGVSWWYGTGSSAAQDVFITELLKTGKFRVIDRETLAAQMAEQDLSLSGRIDAATAVSAGRILGVQYFLTGALTEWEHEQQSASSGRFLSRIRGGKSKWSAAMNARLVDTETGEVVWADEASANDNKYKVTVDGVGGGSDYSINTISTLVKPLVEQLTTSLSKAF